MKVLESAISRLQLFLEKIDSYRDKFLFLFIKPYWPRSIKPNHVTWVRTLIAVLLFVLIFFYDIQDRTLILTLFIIGVITDFVDGSVARGLNQVTEFGAMLDATSDKILLVPIAVYSLMRNYRILLLILFLMEISNTILSIYYKSKEIYLESNIFGKTKMFLLCLVFIVMLYMWPNPPSQLFIYILWLTVPFTLLNMFTRINELLSTKNAKTQS